VLWPEKFRTNFLTYRGSASPGIRDSLLTLGGMSPTTPKYRFLDAPRMTYARNEPFGRSERGFWRACKK